MIYLEKVVKEQKHFYVFASPPVREGHMSCFQHRVSLCTPQSHVRTLMCLWCMGGCSPSTHVCAYVNIHVHGDTDGFCQPPRSLTFRAGLHAEERNLGIVC